MSAAHAENFLSANRPGVSEIGLELRPGGVVGAVPLRAPDTRRVAGAIVVRPRFGWGGIGQVLREIGWSASPTLLEMPLVPGAAREVPPSAWWRRCASRRSARSCEAGM
ncbi:MAG: hypothetical protein M0Z94_16105 [Dehalococcoidales bacterium]|nr:hypothetical protein [Dehalococcoidales bacterium]